MSLHIHAGDRLIYEGSCQRFNRIRKEVTAVLMRGEYPDHIKNADAVYQLATDPHSCEYVNTGDFYYVDRPIVLSDPIGFFLAHSDYEGRIQHWWCLPLALELEKCLPLGDQDLTQRLQVFIDGLKHAAEIQDDVRFG